MVDLGEPFQVITETEYTLDAGPGFLSYLWQDGSTEQTFTISQPGIGTYSVTVTDANGCEVTEEVEIMLAVPDVGILNIISPQSSCDLSETEQLVVAIKNFGNYALAPGAELKVGYSIDGAEAIIETVPITESFDGGDTLTYTFTNSEDLSAPATYQLLVYTEFAADKVPANDVVFTNVTVLGSPEVDISYGKDTLYTSNPVTLTVPTGYASYTWQDGSSGTDYLFGSPGYGLVRIDVAADNGCVSSDSIFIVYDIPDLAISSVVAPQSSCSLGSNESVIVEITNNGYFWITTTDTITLSYSVNSQSSVFEKTTLDTRLMPGESRNITFSQGHDFSQVQTYTVNFSLIYEKDKNFSNNLLNTSLHVWGSPEVTLADGAETVETSLPYTLDAGSGFSSYLWQDNSTGSTLEVTSFGTKWVQVTDENGCVGADTVLIKDPTFINNSLYLDESISFYPVPATDFLHLIMEMEGDHPVSIEIYSVVNKLLYRRDIDHRNYSELQLDVRDFVPGSYFLRIVSEDMAVMHKIIVQ